MGLSKTGSLKKNRHEGEFGILAISLAISLFGVVMDFSASYYKSLSESGNPYYYLKTAIMWFFISWAGFIIMSYFDYHWIKPFSIPVLIAGFVLLGLIFTSLGKTLNNATRWLDFKVFTVMPGEVIKTCFIIYFSWFYSINSRISYKIWPFFFNLGIAGAAAVLIAKQPNLSTAIIVFVLAVALMFIAGSNLRLIILCAIIGVAGFAAIVSIKGGYWITRLTSFIDPFADALGSGYQVVQGLLAMGSGGLTGVGAGNSVQKALYLPEPQSDFILPIIIEEFGFIGALILFLAYFYLIYFIFKTAINAKDKYGMILSGGVGIHLGLQVILNVLVVCAWAPPTGVTLPMVSLGGNSLLLFLAELGIVYNISKYSNTADTDMEE